MKIQVTKTDNIYALSEPVELRFNRQAGMIAVDNIDLSSPDTVAANGRGKSMTIAIVEVTLGLFGTIGKKTGAWGHVVGVILNAEHSKLIRGLVVDFYLEGGRETAPFKKLKQDAELCELIGVEADPVAVSIVFNRAINTQYGTTIKPPTISVVQAAKEDAEMVVAARDLYVNHPSLKGDPAMRHNLVYGSLEPEQRAVAVLPPESPVI
jgi:hypothetical protein